MRSPLKWFGGKGTMTAKLVPLLAAGWRRVQWATVCSSAARTRGTSMQGEGAVLRMQARTETLYCSPGVLTPQLSLPGFEEPTP